MGDKKIDTTFEYIKLDNYNNINEIANSFPHLSNVNKDSIDFNNIKAAKCFVIRSNTDDDVHKAIKYGVWTTTPKNQEKLNQAYINSQKENTNVFLFFSVVKSGQFEGIARLTSGLQQINFPYWWQQGKWKSLFTIEWIYIKDVAYSQLDEIFNIDDMTITRSRDGTEVLWEDNGKKMFKIFSEMDNKESIFKDFIELDEREQQLRDQKFTPQRHNQYQTRQYNNMNQMQQQQQYMQMMNMWYQQMMWQQQMYQQQQYMQQAYYSQQYQQQQGVETLKPNIQNISEPIEQQQNE